mgnify:CR=1 FL=1
MTTTQLHERHRTMSTKQKKTTTRKLGRFEAQANRIGYITIGHMLDYCVHSERCTLKEARIAMREWASEDNHSPDYAWDQIIGPALDDLAKLAISIATNPKAKGPLPFPEGGAQ